MTRGQPVLHKSPEGDQFLDKASKDALMMEFARRLQAAMDKKGWNQSELARNASLHMEEGEINRDLISRYINLKNFPHPKNLAAIAAALGMDKDDLMPAKSFAAAQPSVVLTDLEDGKVRVVLRDVMSKSLAYKILGLIEKERSST